MVTAVDSAARFVQVDMPRWIKRLFCTVVPRSRACTNIRVSTESYAAADRFYAGLHQGPDHEVEFPLTVGGRRVMRRTTVAELGHVQWPAARAARTTLERRLRDLDVRGVLTYDQRHRERLADPRLYDAARFLSYPFPRRDGEYPLQTVWGGSVNVARLPSDWPNVKAASLTGWRPPLPGPLLYDAARFSDEQLVENVERIVAELHEYLVALNCTPRFHPLVLACMSPMMPGPFHIVGGDACTNGPELWDRWRHAANPELWSRWSDVAFTYPDTDLPAAPPIMRGPSDPVWRASVRNRRATTGTGAPAWTGVQGCYVGDHYQTRTADAATELARLCQAVDLILASGDTSDWSQGCMVDLHVTTTAYQVLYKRTYRQLGQSYGTDLVAFERGIQRERQARSRATANNAVNATGYQGGRYQSSGNDAEDVAAWTIGTLSLAIETAATAGVEAAIVAVVMSAVNALLQLFGADAAPPDPTRQPLRLFDGAAPVGLSPRQVYRTTPVVRVQ